MPGRLILSERNAFALDGSRDKAGRFAGLERQVREAVVQSSCRVPVDIFYSKAKSSEALGERLHVDGVLGKVALLDSVAINDDDEIVESVLLRGHRSLPVRSLLKLAIACENKNPPRFLSHATGGGGAHRDRQPMAQRTGIGFHAW